MNCIICDGNMAHFFSKTFKEFNLSKCDYHKCDNCGFVASKTHYDLTTEEWERLNFDFHTFHNKRKDNPFNRNQRYLDQALMISILKSENLFFGDNFLDWASGEGSVSILTDRFFNITINNYDSYIKPQINAVSEGFLEKESFDLVINCGLFEHVTIRTTLDEINSLVSKEGALAIHTLIPENVPKNPDWMYLLPVHTSFHTNKSMQILMDQWGYKCSVYNEHSKLWVLFKKDFDVIKPKVDNINKLLGWEYLKFKSGFMNYWK